MNPPKIISNSINSSLPMGVLTLEIIAIPNVIVNRQLMKKSDFDRKTKIGSPGLLS